MNRVGLDDLLLVPGIAGVSVSIGGLFGALWGLLVLSLIVLAGGVLVSVGGRP